MLIAWDNRADDAALTVGSEIATLPGVNVQQQHLSRKWHTAAGVKTSHLIWDFGAAVTMGLGMLVGTNLTAAGTVRWRASTLDATVVANLLLDTGVVNAGAKAGYGASYKSWANVSGRYWRADIEDLTVASNLQIGRALPMPKWDIPTTLNSPGGYLWNWSIMTADPSRKQKSHGGQSYAERLPQYRVLQFVLDFNAESHMYDNAFALARANGIVDDVLAIPDIASAYLSEKSVWGQLVAAQPLIHRTLKSYQMKFEIEERL